MSNEKRKGFHAASVEKSPRLQRLKSYLHGGLWHSTRDIMHSAHICAVSTAVSELRSNGMTIETRRDNRVWYYRMVL